MPLNRELLQRTLDYIEAHPDEHRQGTWSCGTTKCFAGWAATLEGGEWAPMPKDVDPEFYELVYMIARPDDPQAEVEGGLIHVEARAQHILGLEDGDADELFYCCCDIADVGDTVAEILHMNEIRS